MNHDSQQTVNPSFKDYLTKYNMLNNKIRDALNKALEQQTFYYCVKCNAISRSDYYNSCCKGIKIQKGLVCYTNPPRKSPAIRINMLQLLQYMAKVQKD